MAVLTKETVSKAAKDRPTQIALAGAAAAAGALAAKRGLAARRNGHDGPPDRAYSLRSEERPSAGMSRIVNGRIDKAAERLAAAQEAEDPTDCVHGARKDLKKLRSALRLLRDELGDERYRAENSTYREAGRLLSHTRDAEVKVETLEGICERCAGALPAGAADEWIAVLREERDLAVESSRDGGSAGLAEALELVEESRQRVGSWHLEKESWDLVGPGIERAYRRGRKRMRRTVAEPSAANIHEWRKRAKDLWYHLRILEVATPKQLSDRVEIADSLADALGDHHDLAVLRDDLLVRDLPTVKRAALVAAIAQRQGELAGTAFELGERLYSEKPKRFRKKMRRGWHEWRDS
jgi:CHAD domain-containing protein